MAIYPLTTGTGRSGGFRLVFSPDFKSSGGARLRTSVTTVDSKRMPAELRDSVQNAITRWVHQVLNKKIPVIVQRVLFMRTGKLARARAYIAGVSTEGEGRMNFQLNVNLGGAAQYGGVQEYGRAETSRVKGKYYIVPATREARNEVWDTAKIKAQMSEKGVFWTPLTQDRHGRDVRLVLQMRNPAMIKRYEKSAKGLRAAREKLIEKAQEQRNKRRGIKRKALTRPEALKAWAKLLFLAYPNTVTSIPGVSKPYAAKGRDVFNSPEARAAGIGANRIKGRGPGEASRWWSRSLADASPDLQKYLTNPQMRAAIRASLQKELERQSGISFGGRLKRHAGAE